MRDRRVSIALKRIAPATAAALLFVTAFLPASGGVAATAAVPTISGFTPSSGPPGTAVTITGTGFTGATAVAFNGVAASFTIASDAQINTTVPAGATTGPVTVTTPDGTGSSAAAQVSFVAVGVARALVGATSLGLVLPSGYQAGDLLVAWLSFGDNAQSITGMSGWTELPWSPLDDGTLWHVRAFYKIAAAGETAPTLHWTNNTKAIFETGAWRGVSATNPILTSGGALDLSSSINVNTPSVSNSLTGAWAIGFFSFRTTATANNNTSFSSFTPAGLTKRADANLSGATSSAFENVATTDTAGAIATGAHQYTGITNATSTSSHKAAALIYITPGGGGNFTVSGPAPTVGTFSPTSGGPGTAVTITGTNLTGATSVTFNGTTAAYTVASNTQINATVPAGATSGPITVVTPNGAATSSTNFTLTGTPPAITSFSPTTGPAGTAVTITGTGFTGATAVAFSGTTATFTVASATQINATVPTGAGNGPITVTTPNGTATSSSSFSVGGASPTITSFTPVSGSAGTAVTIAGTNFTGATAVAFNGTAATYTVGSNTQISTTVPAGASSGPITVTTPNGTATSSNNFTVGGSGQSFIVYGGYYDTHHTDIKTTKPTPWQGAPGVVFVGTPDSPSGGWDSTAVRIDNVSSNALNNVVVSVGIGSHTFALWGSNSIPAGASLILAQTSFQNFDGSDTSPAGCYGCDPTLCLTSVSSTVPVVHVTVNGTTTNISDTHQVLNTGGVDSAGCPDTGFTTVRREESETWQQLGSG
jgi:hypothetical protein